MSGFGRRPHAGTGPTGDGDDREARYDHRMRRLLLTVALAGLFTNAGAAFQAMLDAPAIQEALSIGQSRLAAERSRFQQPYRVIVNAAPIDYIEIVTPFRRVELAAEARAAAGDRGFGQRQALELLAASADRLDIDVELTFHPLNTYIGVPGYTVTLAKAGGSGTIAPLSVDRIPRFGPRVDGVPLAAPAPAAAVIQRAPTQPMLGGTVVARFDTQALDPMAVYVVLVTENDREAGRATVDLSRVR